MVGWTGSAVQLTHLRPSEVGTAVEIVARVEAVGGRRINFLVVASNEDGRECGRAEITRVLVRRNQFTH